MTDLDERLRDYAERWRQAQPPPARFDELPGRTPSRGVVAAALTAAVVAVLVVAAVWFHGSRATQVSATPGATRPSASAPPFAPQPSVPAVPHGWRPVVFDSVQFDVPASWPVYSGGCPDFSISAVYLGTGGAPGSCRSTQSINAVVILVSRDLAPSTTGAVRSIINGLDVLIRRGDAGVLGGGRNSFVLLVTESGVELDVAAGADVDQATLNTIASTVSPAEPGTASSVTYPPGPAPATTTTIVGASGFCAAIAEFRSAPNTTDASGQPSLAGLLYLQRAEQVAPASLRPPLDVVINWLRQGAPRPVPAAVQHAEGQSTADWASNCPAAR